ncbi:MAG TPA: S41 family peptidase [Syntrophomonadaceae bacterium]|nr:S41 family peptidase [Syntrophomonadaceae bacterium]
MYRIKNNNVSILSSCSKIFTALILTAMLALSFPLEVLAQDQDNISSEVKQIIEEYYVDEPTAEVMQANTADEVIKALNDPYTEYFSAQEYQEFASTLNEEFSGIGIYIESADDGARVVTVFKGSPAASAGIRAGDIIVKAGEQSMAELSEEEIGNILQGPVGSTIKISIQRGQSKFCVYVTRRLIPVPTVAGEIIKGHTGYIQISTFGSNTGAEFGDIVKDLRTQGAHNWIIDLRDNPGGYVESACKVAGYFIGSKTVTNIESRNEWVDIPAVSQGTIINEPVTLLINNNSASASEIIAAAIKDYDKGVLMGTTTYGKGTMQDMFRLSNGDVLKMTVARFYSPQMHEINHVGVSPDIWMGEN